MCSARPASASTPRMRAMLDTPATSPGLKAALVGGLAAAVLDFAAACIASGSGPVKIGQVIATGLLGPAAMKAGLPAAVLGAAAHTVILLVVAGIYVLAARRMDYLWRQPVVSGVIFGLIVYGIMNAVVLPFSNTPMGAGPTDLKRAIQIGIHMAFVGLPIALSAWKIR